MMRIKNQEYYVFSKPTCHSSSLNGGLGIPSGVYLSVTPEQYGAYEARQEHHGALLPMMRTGRQR